MMRLHPGASRPVNIVKCEHCGNDHWGTYFNQAGIVMQGYCPTTSKPILIELRPIV